MKAFLAMLLLAAPVPAAAADKAQGAAESGSSAEAPKKAKKICKREQTSSGLYATKRVCLTADQWRARNKRSEDTDAGGITTR